MKQKFLLIIFSFVFLSLNTFGNPPCDDCVGGTEVLQTLTIPLKNYGNALVLSNTGDLCTLTVNISKRVCANGKQELKIIDFRQSSNCNLIDVKTAVNTLLMMLILENPQNFTDGEWTIKRPTCWKYAVQGAFSGPFFSPCTDSDCCILNINAKTNECGKMSILRINQQKFIGEGCTNEGVSGEILCWLSCNEFIDPFQKR